MRSGFAVRSLLLPKCRVAGLLIAAVSTGIKPEWRLRPEGKSCLTGLFLSKDFLIAWLADLNCTERIKIYRRRRTHQSTHSILNGAVKVHAHWMSMNYRESYGITATSGILCNHESGYVFESLSRAKS